MFPLFPPTGHNPDSAWKIGEMKRLLLILPAIVLLLLLPDLVIAQNRSDTGRHKSKPMPKKAKNTEILTNISRSSKFHIGLLVGNCKGSSLFNASTVNGNIVPWSTLGGGSFNSARFSTKMHHNLMVGFLARYVYSPGHFNGASIRLGLDYSELEILAQAISGQVGSLLLYDRASVVNLSLGWEYPMADLASYPFVGAEILLNSFNPSMAFDLDQTNFGGRVLFGYILHLRENMGLRIEGHISRTVWSAGDFMPETTLETQPEIEFSGEDHTSYFDFLVGLEWEL